MSKSYPDHQGMVLSIYPQNPQMLEHMITCIYNTLYYIYYIYILSHLQVANPSYQWIVMDYPIEKKVAYNSL